MPLFQLGALTISSPGPFNATDTSEEFGADFGVKPLVGTLQDREFDGPSDGRFTISGTLFPYFYQRAGQTSGLDEIETLRGMANTGSPQTLVRGDGMALGNWLVEKVTQKSARLSTEGVGMIITYDISLVKTLRTPDATDQVSTLQQVLSNFESLFQ